MGGLRTARSAQVRSVHRMPEGESGIYTRGIDE